MSVGDLKPHLCIFYLWNYSHKSKLQRPSTAPLVELWDVQATFRGDWSPFLIRTCGHSAPSGTSPCKKVPLWDTDELKGLLVASLWNIEVKVASFAVTSAGKWRNCRLCDSVTALKLFTQLGPKAFIQTSRETCYSWLMKVFSLGPRFVGQSTQSSAAGTDRQTDGAESFRVWSAQAQISVCEVTVLPSIALQLWAPQCDCIFSLVHSCGLNICRYNFKDRKSAYSTSSDSILYIWFRLVPALRWIIRNDVSTE